VHKIIGFRELGRFGFTAKLFHSLASKSSTMVLEVIPDFPSRFDFTNSSIPIFRLLVDVTVHVSLSFFLQQATMICIDNSEWMRNGDYTPSRFQAQADAVNLICGAKTQVRLCQTVQYSAFTFPPSLFYICYRFINLFSFGKLVRIG